MSTLPKNLEEAIRVYRELPMDPGRLILGSPRLSSHLVSDAFAVMERTEEVVRWVVISPNLRSVLEGMTDILDTVNPEPGAIGFVWSAVVGVDDTLPDGRMVVMAEDPKNYFYVDVETEEG